MLLNSDSCLGSLGGLVANGR